jgi:hypothetical protein
MRRRRLCLRRGRRGPIAGAPAWLEGFSAAAESSEQIKLLRGHRLIGRAKAARRMTFRKSHDTFGFADQCISAAMPIRSPEVAET